MITSASSIGISQEQPAKPFLKWVGGKRQLLPALLKALPSSYGRYFEPFVGGGALFFKLSLKDAYLADLNQELIDCYMAIRDCVEDVIDILNTHRYEKDYYYKVRAVDPLKLSLEERAARMIFLNRTGFNGLYRVNSKGAFNVPIGRHKNPLICDRDNLRACSVSFNGIDFACAPFQEVLNHAKKGDLVYFDPPYIPLSRTANFTAYEKTGFGMGNQEELAKVFESLNKRGVFVMLSNSDVPWMKKRYSDFNIRKVRAKRNVNRNANDRGFVGELIVTNY